MFTDTEYLDAFDASIGANLTSLTSTAEKLRWFNAGQARLRTFSPASDTITWTEGDVAIALPSDFRRLDQLVYDENADPQQFVQRGKSLFVYDADGATADGGATIYYDGDWPALTAADDSQGTAIHDETCLSFALSRFYQKLASDRSVYTRYANLVGANAVGIEDLVAQANQHYQDFLDARDDIDPEPPVSHTPGD